MASSTTSTYAKRLAMVDSVTACKECFSPQHYELLVDEAMKETRLVTEKLDFVLALARRCRAGEVAVERLRRQIDELYSLPPAIDIAAAAALAQVPAPSQSLTPNPNSNLSPGLPSPAPSAGPVLSEEQDGGEEEESAEGQQEGGGEEEGEAGYDDIDTEVDELEEHEEEEEQEGENEQGPQTSDEKVNKLIEEHKYGFFQLHRWGLVTEFVVPCEGFWLDAHGFEKFRTSTYEDFTKATPKEMPIYINDNPMHTRFLKSKFNNQKKSYDLCRKIAVSSEGDIFRAPDAAIEAALASTKGTPVTDVATYVKAVQEIRRRFAENEAKKQFARQNRNQASGQKRRRVHVTL